MERREIWGSSSSVITNQCVVLKCCNVVYWKDLYDGNVYLVAIGRYLWLWAWKMRILFWNQWGWLAFRGEEWVGARVFCHNSLCAVSSSALLSGLTGGRLQLALETVWRNYVCQSSFKCWIKVTIER